MCNDKQWEEYLRALGVRIRQLRMEQMLSESALAEKAGLTEGECQELEDGSDCDPDLRCVVAVAHALGASVDGLLTERWPSLGRDGASTNR